MSYGNCDRCGRELGRASWAMSLTSLWSTPTPAYLFDPTPAYRYDFRVCEECAGELMGFMRTEKRDAE